jgi:hypothetical protein
MLGDGEHLFLQLVAAQILVAGLGCFGLRRVHPAHHRLVIAARHDCGAPTHCATREKHHREDE